MRTKGRGDLLANLLFYMPFGFLAVRTLIGKLDRRSAVIATIATGALLSLAMELLQHFIPGRVSAMSDFYLNSIGTAAGAVAGKLIRVACDRLIDRGRRQLQDG